MAHVANNTPASRVTGIGLWRRIATATWRAPADPQIYGDLELEAGAVLDVVEHVRATGVHATPTHVVGWALARTLAAVPELNVQLTRRRFRPRDDVSVFFIATGADPHELTGVRVDGADRLSVAAFGGRVAGGMHDVRSGRDPTLERTKTLVNVAPSWLLRPALRLVSWLANDVGVNAPQLGLPQRPFGSAMVTSVGGLGLDHGYAPLGFFYRVPLLLYIGRITDRAVVHEGAVVARPILPISASIDHRYVDGYLISHAVRVFRAHLEDPIGHGALDEPDD